MKIIQGLRCVDCAVPQNEYSPIENIKSIQPDIAIESTSHIGNPYLKELRKAFKGRIVMLPYYKQVCSTDIKKKIKEN